MTDIEEGVRACVAKIARISPESITAGDRLSLDVGLSSLEFVMLVTNSFKQFSVSMDSIDEQELSRVKTVADLTAMIFERTRP